MKRRSLLFVISLLLILSVQVCASGRVIVLSWDGAADWIVDKLLSEGELPNVATLAKNGVKVEYMTSSYPSLTAAAHASLWTGAYGNVNGITGNSIPVLPRKDHTVTEIMSGFLAEGLIAEPIWMTAVRSGKRAALLQATQTEPTSVVVKQLDADGIPKDRLYVATGFTYPISGPGVFNDLVKWKDNQNTSGLPAHTGLVKRIEFKVGETAYTAFAFDSSNDPAQGFDSVLVKDDASRAQVILKPGWSGAGTINKFSKPFAVIKGSKKGYTIFRLFELSTDGSKLLFYHTSANALDSNQPSIAAALLAAAGGYYDGGFSVYGGGKLGKPIHEGGDGTAERRLLELVRLDMEKLKLGTLYGINKLKWDLMLHYSPFTDSAGHAWVGVLDPKSPAYNPETAAKLWPYMKQVYRLHDSWLGAVVKSAPKDACVMLVSDHGMEGTARWFYTNRLFEQAGLAKLDSKGRVDPSASKIAAIGNGASIYVNTTNYKGGIVPPEQKQAVIEQVESLLLSAKDPATGRNIVSKLFHPDDAADIGAGGIRGADIMIDLADGYSTRDSGGSFGVLVEEIGPIGLGIHGGYPSKVGLRAILYMGGQGIKKGASVPPVRIVDVAPTISKLMGIRPPKDAVGLPISPALR